MTGAASRRPRPRLLTAEEVDRQLIDLPGVHRGAAGTLVLAVRAPSFEEAVQLVRLVAEDAELMDHHPDIDLRWTTLTFGFTTHVADPGPGVTQLDIELAHQVRQAAASVGAQVLPPPERVEVALDVRDAGAVRPFWAAALGCPDRDGELTPADGPVLWFQQTGEGPDHPRATARGRFHLDVYVPDDAAPARVQACLDAGGRLVSDAFAPAWWVLADAEGNECCICTRADPPA